MTRKDYVLIAEALKRSRPIERTFHSAVQLEQWRYDRDWLANYLKAGNPRFDIDRFVAATGGH